MQISYRYRKHALRRCSDDNHQPGDPDPVPDTGKTGRSGHAGEKVAKGRGTRRPSTAAAEDVGRWLLIRGRETTPRCSGVSQQSIVAIELDFHFKYAACPTG